jgi:hypothetical protein
MDENLSLLRRMFCCGISSRKFDERYQSLDVSEQKRLIRVAERFQMTYVIRYDLSVFSQPGMGDEYEFRIEYLELSSLEVYLLLTCIDTLSGEPDYSQFDQWSSDNLEDRTYTKDEIIKRFREYRNDFGPRSTIRQEFLNLPEAHKEWIKQNVAILRSTDFPDEDVIQKNSKSLFMRLFKYFYDVRRNEYTHASKTRQTVVNRDYREEHNGWSITASGKDFVPDNDKPNKKFCLWYRPSLDEATILRVIIHGAILRKLNLSPDHLTIETYLMNERRRKVITGLIREIKENTRRLSWWGSYDCNNISPDLSSYLFHYGITRLSRGWSESFVKITFDVNLERGLKTQIENYLQALEIMNLEIDKFNEQYFNDQLSWEEKAERINSFIQQFIKTAEYNLIVGASNPRTIGNLLLIRRDPCYT